MFSAFHNQVVVVECRLIHGSRRRGRAGTDCAVGVVGREVVSRSCCLRLERTRWMSERGHSESVAQTKESQASNNSREQSRQATLSITVHLVGQEGSWSNQTSGFTCNACAIRSSPLLQPHARPAPDRQIPAPATLIKGNQDRSAQAPVERRVVLDTERYTAVTCHNKSYA